ncbi:MAG: hypothetical protein ACKPKO_36250, partial [Candidatus Fonsibacter sp.]
MYKTFKLHDHDLKFHTKDIKEEQENHENPNTNSKDYDTSRRLVKYREHQKRKYFLRYSIAMVEVIANSL